jgi:hypothetical protein
VRGRSIVRSLTLAVALVGFAGFGQAKAQDWNDYLHWPYTPPQVPGNGFEYRSLHDGFYLYPREQRIVPQVQGPYYRNFYGGKKVGPIRKKFGLYDWDYEKKYYRGNHFVLDVF